MLEQFFFFTRRVPPGRIGVQSRGAQLFGIGADGRVFTRRHRARAWGGQGPSSQARHRQRVCLRGNPARRGARRRPPSVFGALPVNNQGAPCGAEGNLPGKPRRTRRIKRIVLLAALGAESRGGPANGSLAQRVLCGPCLAGSGAAERRQRQPMANSFTQRRKKARHAARCERQRSYAQQRAAHAARYVDRNSVADSAA